jgi:tetratricopeptide (TPR) repeat protein
VDTTASQIKTQILLLCAAILLVFGMTLASPFQYDDHSLIAGPSVWLQSQTRPLTYATFWINRALGGDNPLGYHAVNLSLHLAASLLLLSALRRIIPPQAAMLAVFIFAVHPLQVEAVAYIFARSTLLATLFCLLSLNLWLRDRPWLAVAAFALALLAKEECAAFPVALALLPDKRPVNLKPIAAMLAMALTAVARVALATASIAGSGAGSQAGVSSVDYFLTQGTVILRYARQLFIPSGLSIDPLIPLVPPLTGLLSWLLIALACRFNRWILLALILILPTSSIFPAADLAADRRVYLPMLALSAAGGLLLSRINRSWIAVAVLAAVSFQRVQVWKSEQSLWADAQDKAPSKLRPKIWLLRTSTNPVSNETANSLRSLAPDSPAVANELGRAFMIEGRYQEALAEFARAVALAPTDALAYNNRGAAFLALGLREPAIESFKEALKLQPDLTEAKENLLKTNARPK